MREVTQERKNAVCGFCVCRARLYGEKKRGYGHRALSGENRWPACSSSVTSDFVCVCVCLWVWHSLSFYFKVAGEDKDYWNQE